MATTTPLDIITESLRSIGAVASGESPTPDKVNFAFDMLNDMLDSLSNDRMFLFCQQEVIHELTAGQFVYTMGPNGSVGASFNGSIAGNVLTVSALVSGALSVGQNIIAPATTTGAITGLDVQAGTFFSTQPTLTFAGDGVGAAATIYLQLAPGAQPSVTLAGTGYFPGDLLTVVGGTFIVPATVRVVSVGGGGAITALANHNTGQYTAVTPAGNPALLGGRGSGATLTSPIFGIGPAFLTNPGSGYSFVFVTVVGGGGGSNGVVGAIIGGTPSIPGTTITSYGTATGGNGLGALGSYYLNLSQTVASASFTASAPRPLRINNGTFVRISSTSGFLDYPVDVLNVSQYERIGLKSLNGPWPRGLYYQPSMPLGVLNYWPNPSQGEMHLMCDMLLNQFATVNDTITLPPGYKMALRWMLAELLMPNFPATAAAAEIRQMIPSFASQARAMLKRTNMQPMDEMQFDSILNSSRRNNPAFIMDGGFGR